MKAIMSTWFIRFLLMIIVCLSIAHAYPSSMSKHKWLRARLGHQPHALFEVLPNNFNTDLIENDDIPIWLHRSRKFCCAPPL